MDATTDTGTDLLAAILAEPADDTVRLVYADWLEENEQPSRADFIRVQCKLANYERTERDHEERRKTHPHMLPFGGHCDCSRILAADRPCPYCRAVDRERELLNWHSVWRETHILPLGLWVLLSEVTWERGFLASVSIAAADWLAHGDEFVASHPIERVGLSTMPEVRYDFQGGDVKRFAHLKGRPDKKVVTSAAYFLRHEAKMCLEAVWPGIAFTLPPEPIDLESHHLTLPMTMAPDLMTDSYVGMQQYLMNQMAQSLAIPPHLFGGVGPTE